MAADTPRRAAILSCARICAQGEAEALEAESLYGNKPDPHDPLALALRARADAAACHLRFGGQLLTAPPSPATPIADSPNPARHTEYYTALVHARAEALGARWLAGIAANLDHLPPPPDADTTGALQAQVSSWLRAAGAAPANALPPLPAVAPAVRQALPQLLQALHHEARYGQLAHTLAATLTQLDTQRTRGGGGLMRWLNPRSRPLRNRHLVTAAGQAARTRAPDDPTGIETPIDALPEHERPSQGRASSSAQASPAAPPDATDPSQQDPGLPLPQALTEHYRVFTRAHDRVVAASQMAPADERERLRHRLDRAAAPYRHVMQRLAHRLQRRLLASLQPRWRVDLEDGELDPARLTQVVMRPGLAPIFRRLEDAPGGPTAVTLLIDNSGSMRGHPITIAAITVELLAQTLERCRIPTEILGFTTTDRRHGPAFHDWLAAGRPPNPGRLNGVQHIIYKAMDTPWRRSRQDLGLMLKDDILRENIDGEALWWATQRLLQRAEPRRLLIVISDGAPRDTDTLAHNPGHYLDRHLHHVIHWIRHQTDISLYAIGIGHPVDRYYPQAVTLRQVEHLGDVLTRSVGDWLTGVSTGANGHRARGR